MFIMQLYFLSLDLIILSTSLKRARYNFKQKEGVLTMITRIQNIKGVF